MNAKAKKASASAKPITKKAVAKKPLQKTAAKIIAKPVAKAVVKPPVKKVSPKPIAKSVSHTSDLAKEKAFEEEIAKDYIVGDQKITPPDPLVASKFPAPTTAKEMGQMLGRLANNSLADAMVNKRGGNASRLATVSLGGPPKPVEGQKVIPTVPLSSARIITVNNKS